MKCTACIDRLAVKARAFRQTHLHLLRGGGAIGIGAARLDRRVVGGALLATVRGHHHGLARADLLQQAPLLRREVDFIHVIALAFP